jgi:hypothetical protein
MNNLEKLFSDVKAEKVKQLEEGKYNGTFVDVFRDNEQYDYTRYRIKVDDNEITLAVSFPTRITFLENGEPSSQHATFLKSMKYNQEDVGKFITSLIGKKVSFLVKHKVTDNGTFSEIVKDSVKLI